MKTHLTIEDVYDLAYEKLDVSNIKVDKEHELARRLDLEWDEKADAYINPNCHNCNKVMTQNDVEFGKSKKPPYLCVPCYTSNA